MAKAQQGIDEAARALIRVIEDCRRQLTKELDNLYSAKQLQLSVIDKKVEIHHFFCFDFNERFLH